MLFDTVFLTGTRSRYHLLRKIIELEGLSHPNGAQKLLELDPVFKQKVSPEQTDIAGALCDGVI